VCTTRSWKFRAGIAGWPWFVTNRAGGTAGSIAVTHMTEKSSDARQQRRDGNHAGILTVRRGARIYHARCPEYWHCVWQNGIVAPVWPAEFRVPVRHLYQQGDSVMRCKQQPMAWFLSLMLVMLPMLPAQAAMVDNGRIISEQQAALDSAAILAMLDQEVTRQQLETWGVNPEMARERINSLTGEELANINRQLNELKAGGDSILGILLIIFIVFVITDVIGATDIFPFIHPVR
jgi:hypothetical protein